MSTDLITQQPAAVPDYVRQDTTDKGLDAVRQMMRPPFLKVRQAQCRNDEMKAATNLGDIIIMPDCEVLYRHGQERAENGQPFRFVVLFSFREFCAWNPYAMINELPFIRDRTLDPNCELAKRCMVREQEKRMAVCPQAPPEKQNDEKYMLKYMEHLNFIILPRRPDGEILQVPVLWSCVSGEAKTGRRLSNLLGSVDCHIFARNYRANTSERKGKKGEWYGLNPVVDREYKEFVTADEFVKLKDSAIAFRKQFNEGNIEFNYQPEDTSGTHEYDDGSDDNTADYYDPATDNTAQASL